MKLIQNISDEGIEALRSTIGQSPHLLYTRFVEVDARNIWAPNFSLPLGERAYCVVESDWADTPVHAIDYHSIEVSIRDWPKGIARMASFSGQSAMGYPSTVCLRTPNSALIRAHVLETSEEVEDESVRYDRALIFVREDGYQFSLAASDSIRGGLFFSDDQSVIQTLFRDFNERIRLDQDAV